MNEKAMGTDAETLDHGVLEDDALEATATDSPRSRAWKAVGAAIVAMAVIISSALWWQVRSDKAVDDGANKASRVAAASMQRLLTFDPTTVTKDVPAEKKLLTGSFADEYENQMVTKSGPSVIANKIYAQASIARRGIVSASHDQVVVLIFANVARRVGLTDTPEIVGARMRVVMKRVNGKWLISDYKGL